MVNYDNPNPNPSPKPGPVFIPPAAPGLPPP